jgi:hypothetical protein
MTNLERLFSRVNEDFFYRGRRLGFPFDWFRVVIRDRVRVVNRDWSSPGFPNAADWETFNFMRHFIEHKQIQCFFQERLKRLNLLRQIKRFVLRGDFFGRPIKTRWLDLWLLGREVQFRPVFQQPVRKIRKRNRRWGEVWVQDFFRERGPHPLFFMKTYMTVYSNGAISTFFKLPWTKPHRLLLPQFLENGLLWLEFFFFPGEWSMRGLLTRFFLFFCYCILFACVCNFLYSIIFISIRNSYLSIRRKGLLLMDDMGPAFNAWLIKTRIFFTKRFYAVRYDVLSILRDRQRRQKKN